MSSIQIELQADSLSTEQAEVWVTFDRDDISV